MKIRIKVKPEDFVVNEQISLPIRQKGDYRIYLLEKQNWNTVDVLIRLAQNFKIPLPQIGYGGKKDRYGLTRQYITTPRQYNITTADKSYSILPVGYCDEAMQPVSIIGNHFSVVVRQLKIHDIQSAQKTIPQIQQNGYNNYFDDQRFGSFDRDQGFLGDKLLKQQLNGALKIYVTGIHPENSKEEKERKRFFFSHWKDWQSCMQVAETQAERRTFDSLCRHPHDFLSCLRQIPHEAMSLYLSAYQSFLWNKVLTKITIKVSIPPLQIYPGTAGEYQFYDQLLHGQRDFLENLQIPTYGQGLNYPDPFIRKTYQEVLSEEGLKPGSYNQLRIRQSFMKSFNRPAIIRPESIQCQFQNDEIYPSNLKLHLDFSLPRGAYATMLLKRIFSQSSLHPSMPETVTN